MVKRLAPSKKIARRGIIYDAEIQVNVISMTKNYSKVSLSSAKTFGELAVQLVLRGGF